MTSNNQRKDGWDKVEIVVKIVSLILIPIAAFTFTFFFKWKENKKAAEMLNLTKAERVTALLPWIFDQDKRKSDLAWDIIRLVDESFVKEFSERKKSAIISSEPEKKEGKEIADKGKDNLKNELIKSGLLEKLKDAQNYLEAGAPNSNEEALKLYNEVIKIGKLDTPPQNDPKELTTMILDQKLLREAQEYEKEGYIEDAVRKYRSVFEEYVR